MSDTMQWQGNITIRLRGHEDTYPPGTIEIEKYDNNFYMLKIDGGNSIYSTIVRLNRDELQKLYVMISKMLAF